MKTTTENLKRIFKSYEEVRLAGKHNMLTEAKDAKRAAGLTNEEYWYVLENYTAIRNIFREEENSF